jgi:carbon-monoxide dehydrogenase small subunit
MNAKELKMKTSLHLTVNGKAVDADIDTRMLFVDFLRDNLGLTGTHIGCLTGNCGACTTVLDGMSVKSCTVLAADTEGSEVMTIEGFTPEKGLHSIQQAFVDHHALQCGYCTPGMVLSAYQILQEHPHPDEADIREGIAGNLCRCTGYQNIVRAVQAAAAVGK